MKGVVLMSTYEEFMIIINMALLVVAILTYMQKNPALLDSPPAAGRFSDIFHIAAVRSSRSVFNFIGTEFPMKLKIVTLILGGTSDYLNLSARNG